MGAFGDPHLVLYFTCGSVLCFYTKIKYFLYRSEQGLDSLDFCGSQVGVLIGFSVRVSLYGLDRRKLPERQPTPIVERRPQHHVAGGSSNSSPCMSDLPTVLPFGPSFTPACSTSFFASPSDQFTAIMSPAWNAVDAARCLDGISRPAMDLALTNIALAGTCRVNIQ